MKISFEIPDEDAQAIQAAGIDLSRRAKESFLTELYRRGEISHGDFRGILEIGVHEANKLIKEYSAGHDVDQVEFEKEKEIIRNRDRRDECL